MRNVGILDEMSKGGAEIFHMGHDAFGTFRQQPLAVAGQAMATTDKSDGPHPRRDGGLHALGAVLYDDAGCGINTEGIRREKK